MKGLIQTPPSSSSSSSTFLRLSCLTSASRNHKFPLLLPQAICSSQRLYRCSGVHMEACHNLSKNHIDARFSWGWSETQSLFSKQSINKHLLPLGALVTSEAQPEVTNTPIVGDDKTGVLLLNLGGPETLEDVQPFLFNLFADPDIIRLPRLFRFLQKPLAQFISTLRAPKSKEGYASIGGGSPLRRITDAQA
uniref:Ferrochelatase n=1 Tax=Fagus sylvatica TaxID=28930 RepID=A0A2N9I9L0_FAGSY